MSDKDQEAKQPETKQPEANQPKEKQPETKKSEAKAPATKDAGNNANPNLKKIKHPLTGELAKKKSRKKHSKYIKN